jgi:hypothetical protein
LEGVRKDEEWNYTDVIREHGYRESRTP